jgi:tetratricopeptide (TPR) repeat protein
LVEGQEGMGMAPDKYREVFDLAQRGTRAFRDRRFDEAISFYSKALNLRPGDPIILSNRSLAFCRISQLLRERSAADSEYQPLNGLDPTTHAELALKDAEKIISINSNSPRPYLLKAYALILLEHYHEAREALLAGLQVDPLRYDYCCIMIFTIDFIARRYLLS